MQRFKYAFIIVLICWCNTFAEKYNVNILTNEDGLSNSAINTIFQDSNELLWFGTWDGLNMYNGRNFKVFKPDPNDKNTICNNIIRNILEEKKSVLWISTDQGISRYNTETNKFDSFFTGDGSQQTYAEKSFLITKNLDNIIFAYINDIGLFYFDSAKDDFVRLNNISINNLSKIFFDINDNLWLFGKDKQLHRVILKKESNDALDIDRILTFKHLREIENVFYTQEGILWLQSPYNKLYSYHTSEGELSEDIITLPETKINSITSQDSQYLLLCTNNGSFRYSISEKHLEPIATKTPVLSALAGTQQLIWVGTDNLGVIMLSPLKHSFNSFSSQNIAHFGSSAVRAFAEEKDRDLLWVGTKGNGIYTLRQNPTSDEMEVIEHFSTQNGLLSNSVYCIKEGFENEFWIGSDGKGINYYQPETKKIEILSLNDSLSKNIDITSVYSILPLNGNTLWVGTSGQGMYRLEIDRSTTPFSVHSLKQYTYSKNKTNSLSSNIVYSIMQADSTSLWLATRGGGINLFNTQTEEFSHFRFCADDLQSLSSDDIICLHIDSKGCLWTGTSIGLNKLISRDRDKAIFKRYTEKTGLPNNTIHGILEDSEGHIWISTNKGIAKLIEDNKGTQFISYYKKDGLQNNEFSDGAAYSNTSKELFYFGGIMGFNKFAPEKITRSKYTPVLWLDGFFTDNEEVNISDFTKTKNSEKKLILSDKIKSFQFKFIPIDYLSSSKCELSYMLEGYHDKWIDLGVSNTIVFTNLPQGNYTLKVRCSNADGIWGDNYYELAIRKQPPWWRTTAAYIIYALLLIMLILLAKRIINYQLNIRHEIENRELDKQKIEEIHQTKLRFFTNIAHEFSNSLTLIYGPCEQLLNNYSDEPYIRKHIHTIRSNSERMQRLIQQLIEFRKAETGHLKAHITNVDIVELIKFVADYFLESIEEKRITLTLNFKPETICWNTDQESIEKIIFNLLSNAVKYTPPGEDIIISTESKAGRLLISVKNTGVGIKKEHQNLVFDRFELLEKFEMQVLQGVQTRSGIGLALCKNLVELLHGTIFIDSDEATYTIFNIAIPQGTLTESPEESITKTRRVDRPEYQLSEDKNAEMQQLIYPDEQKGGLVLVIDDDNDICLFIQDILSEKYEVITASNGVEGLELMKIRMPRIVISDVIMPKMNGYEFVKLLKSQELTKHIPIILLSSKGSIDNQIEGLETGADAYLSKPFRPRHLEAMVSNLLQQNKAVLQFGESHLASMEELNGKSIHKEDKELIEKATKIVLENIDNEDLNLNFLINEMALSKMQLYRKLKDIINETPTEFIRNIRLRQAKKLLKSTQMTVQEIMYNCGFNNKAYFYKEFVKKYEMTPTEFRKKT